MTSSLSSHAERKLFSQNRGISPKLQQALQPVHAHQLVECCWRWTRRLVMAPFGNQTEKEIDLFFGREGINPKLQEAVQHVHVHQLAECAWQGTCSLVIAPLRNHTKTKDILLLKTTR